MDRAMQTKNSGPITAWLLFFIFFRVQIVSSLHQNLNDTCIQGKMADLEMEAISQFQFHAGISKISNGKVLSYNEDTGLAQLLLHRQVGNLTSYQIDHYLQTVSVSISSSGEVSDSIMLEEEQVDGLLFHDVDGSGNSARLFSKKELMYPHEYYTEQYLTIVTKNDKTSCTHRLSQFNSHGRILTDSTFGFFQFSPDGR